MKKHAFLIGAYKNPDYLLELIDSLDSENSNFYIHVNKKNDSEFRSFKKKVKKRENIHYYSSIPVKWGGLTLFESQMLLSVEALKDSDNIYFHFITGQDVLIKPLKQFFDFFSNSNNSYIYYQVLEQNDLNYRFNYYHLFDLFDISYSRITLGRTLEWLLKNLQNVMKFRHESIPFKTIYKGSPWWSLHRNALSYCVSRVQEDKGFLKRFKHTFAPDESIFHSLLVEASCSFPIINDNLRYIVWDKSYLGGQKILTETDYSELINSKDFFARKIEPNDTNSMMLVERLKQFRKGFINVL